MLYSKSFLSLISKTSRKKGSLTMSNLSKLKRKRSGEANLDLHDQLKVSIDLANKYHHKQVDKSGLPYILHPLHVMNNVSGIEAKIVAILHDIIEDTPLTIEDLMIHGFDLNIVDAIDIITKIKGEHYDDYLKRVKDNELARIVKIADLSHNMDISRLANPTEKDYTRIEKYRKASEYLKGKSN